MKSGILLTMFSERPEVGGRRLEPLTGGRVAVLEERQNPLVMGVKKGGEVSSWKVYEVLMVATMAAEDLAALAMEEGPGWDQAVKLFGIGVPDDELQEFWAVLEAEMEAIRKARVVPKKKAVTTGGRKVRKRRT
tara:strand:+ start:135 stop:536 length:402 start_codon:yes stop_codon:yes gene_type:complete